ncbi:MAG: hypothetical protein IIW48_04245 [Clostridia bacterium]|nr:hypothetical protein [Clostridia bacterium]
MLIKTVVDETFENAKLYKSHCRADGAKDFQNIELRLAETEYDDAFVETLSRKTAEYYIHTVFTFDYESSSDAGDGRDDYYTEEADEPLDLAACIINDGQLFGVICESFDVKGFLLLDHPETVIPHPGNYRGRNYHFYRSKQFKLIRKM